MGGCVGNNIMPAPEYATHPTPYPDVNSVLQDVVVRIRAILAGCFTGMYVYGSLAQGDFVHDSSDIDVIVITERDVTEDQFVLLGEMPTHFRASRSYGDC
jgi:tRNA nucleotidyltransferase (CCA-adding enzyme)